MSCMIVGIMSMQRVRNYGSFLQAFGLKKIIESMGHTVKFVDYKAEVPLTGNDVGEKNENIILRIMRMLSPNYRAYRKKQIKLNSTFTNFCNTYDREFLPELGVGKEYVYTPKVDVLIIGSDEVFNCTQKGKQVGYSLQLFGKDNQANSLISYAASFGNTTLEKLNKYNVTAEIAYALKQFNDISVRDQNSADIIEKLCGFKPKRHIDPVLLYDFPEVDNIHICLKDYIVVYAYADRIQEDESIEIRKFARERGKKILSLGFYQPFCDEYILSTPLETLAYVKNADYVITDTFHGTVFSIKYQIPFATIIRKSNQQKLGDLLKLFNLQERSVKNVNHIRGILDIPMKNYEIVNILENEKFSAINYLKSNLCI